MISKEKFLKEIKKHCSNEHTNDEAKQPYHQYGGGFSSLDGRSSQAQYSLKPKPNPEQGPNSHHYFMKAGRGEKTSEEKLVAFFVL